MMSPLARQILHLVTLAETAHDFGAWSVQGRVIDGIVVCSCLSDRLEATPKEVNAAIAELRSLNLIERDGVRLQPHARLGLPCESDLEDGEDIRSEMVRLLSDGPVAVDLLTRRETKRKAALGRMIRDGIVAPAGALWRVVG